MEKNDSMWVAGSWTDYELLDAGFGEKLERWGSYVLRRPDPQAIWPADKDAREWRAADAVYLRSPDGGGHWEYNKKIPESWTIGYQHLRLNVKPMQFKHTGIFPEQAVNWDWIAAKIKNAGAPDEKSAGTDIHKNKIADKKGGGSSGADAGAARVLNLFGYTGAATAAAAAAGAFVCHVDAARGIVALAKGNAALSGVPYDRVRYIVDDALKFIKREMRRSAKYDAVIMDPPAYGRGPGGELWKADTHLYDTVETCAGLLSENPLFFIINSYASGISATSIANILRMAVGGRFGGRTESGELGLPVKRGGMASPLKCDDMGLPVTRGGMAPSLTQGGDMALPLAYEDLGLSATRGGMALPCGCCARWERG